MSDSNHDEDDKPTVVLDLNALKKKKLEQEESLNNIVSELEFNVGVEEEQKPHSTTTETFPIIFFDFQSDFFQKSQAEFPSHYECKVVTTLPDLNQCLKSKNFQIVVFYYDGNPRAVNQLSAQIKQKMPLTKTIIVAKNISADKARAHAQTPSGANGYLQAPLSSAKLLNEFEKIYSKNKKSA